MNLGVRKSEIFADARRPADVGGSFGKAIEMFKHAGYQCFTWFEKWGKKKLLFDNFHETT